MLRASLIDITPSCSPFAPIHLTFKADMNSLILGPSLVGGALFKLTI